MNIVVVLLTNKLYLDKCLNTFMNIRTYGKYSGHIVIVYGDDLDPNDFPKLDNYSLQYFPDIDRSKYLEIFKIKPLTNRGTELNKYFQYHKLYLFTNFFKQWNRVFYVDSGMTINKDISPLLNLDCNNILLAQADNIFDRSLKLRCQFIKNGYLDLYEELDKNYNLDVDYFNSAFMYYDTQLIEENTFTKLLELANHYYNTPTCDQAILNLYFIGKWKELDKFIDGHLGYTYRTSRSISGYKYIMIKRI